MSNESKASPQEGSSLPLFPFLGNLSGDGTITEGNQQWRLSSANEKRMAGITGENAGQSVTSDRDSVFSSKSVPKKKAGSGHKESSDGQVGSASTDQLHLRGWVQRANGPPAGAPKRIAFLESRPLPASVSGVLFQLSGKNYSKVMAPGKTQAASRGQATPAESLRQFIEGALSRAEFTSGAADKQLVVPEGRSKPARGLKRLFQAAISRTKHLRAISRGVSDSRALAIRSRNALGEHLRRFILAAIHHMVVFLFGKDGVYPNQEMIDTLSEMWSDRLEVVSK
jgi:hypothetical protein